MFILDIATFGHEAALMFIQRQGWLLKDVEIVFCGSHGSLLERFVTEPFSYATVPLRNSSAGEYTEVTIPLAKFRGEGHKLLERDQFDLPINLFLLVSPSVNQVDELECVMSHEKALKECGQYLDSIGITQDKRSEVKSTGESARLVSELGLGALVGAVAPKIATKVYNLKVLAENIQDDPNNKTIFVLLQNQLTMKLK